MAKMAVLVLAAALAFQVAIAIESPNGIHLSLTEMPGNMRAMWSLPSTPSSPSLTGTCVFGSTPQGLTQTTTPGASYTYLDGGFHGSLFDVVMENLAAGATYYYKCGSESVYSELFKFTMPPAYSNTTIKFIVWGDMGVENLVSSPVHTQAAAAKDVQNNGYTMIVNVGDSSYANDYQPSSNNSHISDQYWSEVQGSAANAPMMLCPGNHEAQFSFAAHLNRTHMPVVGTGPLKRFHYSFNYGPVHFVTLSTEHPYGNGTEQWEFVRQDLARANINRKSVPWVVVWTHHPFYCSSLLTKDTRCGTEMKSYLDAYEDVFNEFGVDVFLAGHNHMYERSFPVRNRVPIKQFHAPGAPVYIVDGAAGTLEGNDPVVFDVPWRAYHEPNFDTGYGRTEVNTTSFTYSHVESRTGRVVDTFTLTK